MTLGKILIVDDEEKLRSLFKRIINLEGYEVMEASSIKEAYKVLQVNDVDVVLCDVKLPDGNGVDFIVAVKEKYPLIEIILVTAYGTIHDGVQAMKNGAFDYIIKGDDNNKVIPLLSKAIEKVKLQKRVQQLESQVGKKYDFDSIIGTSKVIKDAIALARKVAPTDTTVLLLGETGTGKEVFAQAIHAASTRHNKSFLALNCSAFSNDLLESELFGHKEGAFTGATRDKKGLIEEADGGTLFLDEIGEMPIGLQSKLLRVLENAEFIKVGDTKSVKVNVRIIAATNRKPEEEIKEGRFREDLYYRLNVFTIELPSLNERPSDIALLAAHYVSYFAAKTNKRISGIDAEAIKLLQHHQWKGNVRELKNIIERACILTSSPEITISDLPSDSVYSAISSSGFPSLHDVERQYIQKVLRYTEGNKTKTAEVLGIGVATLYRKMEEYKLSN